MSGVDVRIMIPNKPDHMFVYWATYSNVGYLLKAGAKVYIYENGFLHAKQIVLMMKYRLLELQILMFEVLN